MSPLAVAVHFVSTFVVTIAALGGLSVAAGHSQLALAGRTTRSLLATGWLLLAVGAMMHGTGLTGGGPDWWPVAVRSAGYVLLLAGLVGSFRAKIPGVGRLAAALVLFVASEGVLYVSEGPYPGSFDAIWFAGRLLPVLAGFVLFTWLWEINRASIQARFMAVFTVLLVAVVVALSGATTSLFAGNIAAESLRRAAQEADLQKRTLRSQIAESVSRARQVAELDSVRIAVARREELLAATAERLQSPGGPFDTSDFLAFFDPSGAVLALSANGPDGRKELSPEEAVGLSGTKVVGSALNQIQAGSVDTLGSRKIALVGAFPIFNPPGFDAPGAPRRLAGAVALGRLIDRDYLRGLASGEDRQAFLLDRDEVLLGTVPSPEGVMPASEKSRHQIYEQGRVVTVRGSIGGVEYFSSYLPLQQPDGDVLAALVLSERSTVLAETQQDVTRTVFFVALASTALAAALSFLSASKVTRPIVRLTEAAERVRRGDLTARVRSGGKDEVGVLSETFDEMAASLGQLTDDLRTAVETEAGLRSRFETILYSLTDAVIAVDEKGAVVAFNKEAERLLGVPHTKASGAPVETVLQVVDVAGNPVKLPIYDLGFGSVKGFIGGPAAAEGTRPSNGSARPEGELNGEKEAPGRKRARGQANGGRDATPVQVTSAPILSESSGVSGGVAVVRDLTPELQIENMKTAFLSNVSHELRTPLTPIKGYADLLKRKEVGRDKAITFLEGITQSAERLERIVDMLIDFSAMEAGRLIPRKDPIDLNEVTEDLVQKWKAEAPSHEFERKGFDKVPVIQADRKLVPLAIVELIDNAVKFSPKGGKVTIQAQLAPTSNGRRELRISVADRGIGIGKQELSAISDSFAQLDPSATRPYGGLGLGLAYIQRIVAAHQGRLEVKSAPSKGSRFTMILPVPEPEKPAGTKGEHPDSR